MFSVLRTIALLAVPFASSANPLVLYGQHFPHGAAAVDYIYGPEGMWRDQTGLQYLFNYSEACATAAHPQDTAALIRLGATSNVTAPDAHCVLLGDMDDDGEIADDSPSGFAFFEHSGRGMGGVATAPPFHQFWFDDNWLASYMAQVYGRAEPTGLHDHGHAVRWRLLGGDNSHWTPYAPSEHVDRIALNGIYKLNAGGFDGALADWNSIKNLSGAAYDFETQRYSYPAIKETYHLGLWAILSERLLAAREQFHMRDDVVQHAHALRSLLLSSQERDPLGRFLGWITGIDNSRSLINTETTSVAVLALGASSTWVLEPGYAPMRSRPGNYFLRPHNALSAVVGLSEPGHIVYGPYWNLPVGTYDVDFSLRTPANAAPTSRNRLATLDVYDGTSILRIEGVSVESMPGQNQWRRYRLTVDITNPSNLTEFRVFWNGNVNLDVGPVRVTQRAAPAPRQSSAQVSSVEKPGVLKTNRMSTVEREQSRR